MIIVAYYLIKKVKLPVFCLFALLPSSQVLNSTIGVSALQIKQKS